MNYGFDGKVCILCMSWVYNVEMLSNGIVTILISNECEYDGVGLKMWSRNGSYGIMLESWLVVLHCDL